MSDEAGEDRRLWSDKAEHWHRHVGHAGDRNRRHALNPVLDRMLGDVAGLRVLDAGCGTGYLSRRLARRGAEVVAVDYAEGMVELSRRLAAEAGLTIDLRQDDCCRLETIEPASFDRLVSVYVLQDLVDHRAALRAFRRALKAGGRAVVIFGHPFFGMEGGLDRRDDGSTVVTMSHGYFEETRGEEVWRGTDHESGELFEFPDRFTFYHRPLSSYWRAMREAGFRILELDEPQPTAETAPDADPVELERRRRIAWSIAFHLEAED